MRKIPSFFRDVIYWACRPQTPQRNEMLVSFATFKKNQNARLVFIPSGKGYQTSYLSREDYDTIKNSLLEKVNDKYLLKKHFLDYKKLRNLINGLKKVVKKSKTKSELIFCFEKFQEFNNKLNEYVFMPFIIEDFIMDKFYSDLSLCFKSKLKEVYDAISSPTRLHDYQKMRIMICDAVLNPNNRIKVAEKLVDSYYWMNEYSFVEPLFDKKYFLKEIKKLSTNDAKSEKEKLMKEICANKKRFNLALKYMPNDLKRIASLINDYVVLRTERVDIAKMAQAIFREAFDKIADMISSHSGKSWTIKHIAYMLNDEITSYLKEDITPEKEEIESRMDGNFIYYHENFKSYIVKDSKFIKKTMDIVNKSLIMGLIKGNVAYGGCVKGVVRIVSSEKDLQKIGNKDILVAKTTFVSYTPFMKKALAFVTDEGGVTSHAAIVSRELKKPCVVGTKIATKTLKDGDYIEVDANKGIVKILKRK